MADYVELTNTQVFLAVMLITINVAISMALQLQLSQPLLLASLRTVVQLILVGWALKWVFSASHVGWVFVMAGFMTGVAGWTAASRPSRRYRGLRRDTLLSVWCSAWAVTGCALLIVAGPAGDWFAPRHVIPLLGMILGNSLNAVSLAMQTFTETLVIRRDQVEGLLALGATRWEAAQSSIRQSLQIGMMPMINSMSVVGLVSLPGMMTGQLLSGTDPMSAIKYQIVIMFCIASATALATTGAVLLSYRSLFTSRHQFDTDAFIGRS